MSLTPLKKIWPLRHLLALTIVFVTTLGVTHLQAQEMRPAALILTDNIQEQVLAPYLKKHEAPLSAENTSPLIRTHKLETTSHYNTRLKSSIIPLGYDGNETWVSFEVANKSNKESWHLDFGNYFEGRFGFLKDIDVFVSSFDGTVLYKDQISNKQAESFISLVLPKGKRSIVAIGIKPHAGIPTTTPLKIVSSSIKNQIIDKRDRIQKYILFGLIGMMFFFLSLCVSQSSTTYNFFVGYYIILCLCAFLESTLFFFIPILSALVLPALLTLLAMAGLLIVKLLWDEVEESPVVNVVFKTIIITVLVCPIIALFLPASFALIKSFLYFGASLSAFATIPIFAFLQTRYAPQNTMPFVFGWLITLIGISISAASISGLTPILPTTINAFWYALLPQALCFIYALYIKTRNEDERLYSPKTMEIVESTNVSKFRQSKELAEQERLMKVIEQERKVLGELRKSEARRAEEMRVEKERADDANRAKSAFLAVVSHEIRTPMSGIMGMVKMLLDSGLDKKQKEYALTIQESSDAMLALLNDILDFEKVEQGKMDIENIGFDLPRLLRGVVTLMNGHATQKKIELITEIDSDLPKYVKGDPTRLRQILLNLTGNAIKFTDQGRVTIIAKLIRKGHSSKPHEIYLGVKDSGVGISQEGQRKIFDAFSQADKSVSRKFGGTGLGLAISKGLIESMGSNIHINSHEGEGSTFFFTLDMEESVGEETGTTTLKQPEIHEHHKRSMNILIVEDNDVNIKVLRGFLERAPHKLDIAKTAEDCLTKLNVTTYDLILMDIELPGINGDEATKAIRAHENKKIAKTPVIALSGNVLESDIKKYKDAGVNDTLAKPLKPELLNKALDRLVTSTKTPAVKKEETEKPSIFSQDKSSAQTLTSPTKIAPRSEPENAMIKNITKPKTASATIARTSKKVSKPIAPLTTPEMPPSQSQEKESAAFDTSTLDALKGHLEDAQIQEMLDEVFTKSEEIMGALKQALGNNNAKEIYARGHELKGMTGNFGLTEISDIATQIEAQAKAEDLSNVNALIDKMPTALTKARTAAKAWLEN